MNAIEGHVSEDEARAKSEWKSWSKDWLPTVTRQEGGGYMAQLPFRSIVTEGTTEQEAIAGLFRVYCQLARDGSINVERPDRVGAPPIQHVIEILEEQLRFHTACRYDDWRENVLPLEGEPRVDTQSEQEKTSAGGRYTQDPRFTRRNEVISGLATAIAALARVKEL